MAHWKFDTRPRNMVEQDLTQRDQFNNDDVGVAEALVREVIQNSTDAGKKERDGPVKVRFAIEKITGSRAEQIRDLLKNLEPHLSQCGVDTSCLNTNDVDLLLIEDFNTRGLTGSASHLDNDNFHNFWRRHGRSGKGGNAGGRWGLGKLVYSSSSEARAFFGLTIREGDNAPLLMGQCVLSNHEIGDIRYSAFGFYSNRENDDFQMPENDAKRIEDFTALMGISRTDQSGLSIVVPCPGPSITQAALIQSVINNYYFPILSGELVVEINKVVIDADRFDDVVTSVGGPQLVPIEFVKSVSNAISGEPHFTGSSPITTHDISEIYLGKAGFEQLKKRFTDGDLVHVRLPLELTQKDGVTKKTFVDVFLKELPEDQKPYALFARGSITVPREIRYFKGVHAYGAMVASDPDAVAFLGDAENPAHTAWNASAEKLHDRWKNPAPAIHSIRHALLQLYATIGEEQEHREQNALIDFFSLADFTQAGKPKKKKRTAKPKPEITPREKAFRIRPKKGGFTIVPGPAAATWTFPKVMTVQMAYDMLGSNPFTKHSKFDFDLATDDIIVVPTNIICKAIRANALKLTIKSADFELDTEGFDENRDLVVKARTV